jgi:hypothetical protein
MALKRWPSFDPKSFLAVVGEGRSIGRYRKDQIVPSRHGQRPAGVAACADYEDFGEQPRTGRAASPSPAAADTPRASSTINPPCTGCTRQSRP